MTGLILYIVLFSIFCAGAVGWVLERKGSHYHLGSIHPMDALLVEALIIFFVFFSNFFLLAYIFRVNLVIFALLGAFIWFREKSYREAAAELRRGHLDEACELENILLKNPENTACRERLAELYENLGELVRALRHAEKALQMDPIEKNKWKVATLKQELKEKGCGK